MRGAHLICHWSKTQQLIALSSAEAELNASIKAGVEGIGIATMAQQLFQNHDVHLFGDSSANHGILHRAGAGRVKHLSIRQLWLQEKVSLGTVNFTKIARDKNTADMMTHHWTMPESLVHFPRLHCFRCRLEHDGGRMFSLRGGLGASPMLSVNNVYNSWGHNGPYRIVLEYV